MFSHNVFYFYFKHDILFIQFVEVCNLDFTPVWNEKKEIYISQYSYKGQILLILQLPQSMLWL